MSNDDINSINRFPPLNDKPYGTGNAIICEDCKNSFNLQEIRTDPASSKYHNRGCRFVRAESSLASDAIGVPADTSSLDTGSLGNVSSGDMFQPLMGNDISNLSSLSGATNFPEGDASATCCSNFCLPADMSNIKKALQYTAVTYPGSCGAPVICFKPNDGNDLKLDIWMHNGVERENALGVSVLQACTSEDVFRKIPEPTRPAAPRPTENVSRPATVNLPTRNLNSRALSHPSFPVYISYQKRLESFVAWPAGHIHDPHDLARAGFFYAGYADCVRCYQCGLGLKSWKPGDDINVEHERLRPTCPFLQTQLSSGLSSMMDEPNHQRPQLHSETTSGQSSYGSDDNPPLKTQMLVVPTITENQQSPSHPSTDVQQPMDSPTQAPAGNNVRVTPGAANGGEYGGASSLGNYLIESHGSGNTNQTEVRSTVQSDQGIPEKLLLEPSNARHSSSGVDLPSQNKTDSNHGTDSHKSDSVKDITVSLLEREKKLLQHQVNCKICLVALIKDLFLPCGHLYSCVDCSKSLTHCPAWSQLIFATVKTYFT